MKKIFMISAILTLLGTGSYSQEIVLSGKELFGDLSARQIGPALMSGRISDLEGHPTNSRIIYAGTAGGGVWKSTNGGAMFTSISDDLPQSIGVVRLDPNAPDQNIWVGTGETWVRNSVSIGKGLFYSKDGGVNWEEIPAFKNSERISSIEINPENSQEIYVGVLGALWGDSADRGVYKTTDGGATWSKILYSNETTGCSDLIMDPNNPNILYASMWEFRRTPWSFNSGGQNSALLKSTDGGKSWNKIHNGFPEGTLGRIAVAAAPSDPNILYAVLETEKEEGKGLYRSENAGESWKKLNDDFGLVVRPFYFSRIVVDPNDPETVVKGGLFGSISRDGGKTFKNMGAMHADIHDILFDNKDSDRIYAGTDGGVYRSWDGARTMEIVENIPVSQFYHISLDNAEPYNIYGGLQDNGSWYGPSSSPGGIEARDWNSVGAGDGFRVLKHRSKPIIYSEMQGAENVWRYDTEKNKTKTIQPLPAEGDPKLRFNWNAPIALSPNNDDRIYIGSQFLHKSEDMGDNWVKISPDLTTNDPKKQQQEESGGLSVDNSGAENHTTIFTIAESPLNENIIWVGTDDGNVQVTQDGGKNWTNTVGNITGLPKNSWVYHIEASVHNAGTAYAVFDRHTLNDMKPYIYKTTDFGKSWTSLVTPNIEGFARSIQEDYEKEDLLYLGTELGLYITIDGGKNWNKFTNNMPAAAVHHIDLHPKTNDLVMATHGRGIIIIDDISPLREINQEILAKDVHFFKTKPSMMVEQSGFGGGSTETQFIGPNPPRDAQIIYYLKKRHTFGKMSMEIQDAEGKFISELSPGKSKGINVVSWNYTSKAPKMAKGKTITFGGFTAPRVSAGTYKVVMKKGKDTYSTDLIVEYDSTSLLTAEERKFKEKTVLKLYDLSQELAYMVYELDTYLAAAESLPEENRKAAKIATTVTKELQALKESLVVTTGDMYVGAAEPQLREKLSELYSKLASGFDKPSGTEIQNLKLLEKRFNKAKDDFENIKSKEVKKLNQFMEENNIQITEIMTYEEFLNSSL
ncbi:WD40/YVTN/BNR-like repeat-containing protein [Marivirga tractuosa]|nr:hypothetical protein [Marivirga tractuosa]